MNIKVERWFTFRVHAVFCRHPLADRYTVRCGWTGVSLFVTGNRDTVTPVLFGCFVGLAGAIVGALLGGVL